MICLSISFENRHAFEQSNVEHLGTFYSFYKTMFNITQSLVLNGRILVLLKCYILNHRLIAYFCLKMTG